MTIDVEDYFQVSAFEQHIDRSSWDRLPCRVERNMHAILDLLDEQETSATFFTLGWVAERFPGLIRAIVDGGHELASHGYQHIRVTDQTPHQFHQDVRTTKAILEDTGGAVVQGYRAASYSICAQNLWAHEKLAEAGYAYSSSIYPIRHDHYGMPEAPRFAFRPFHDQTFLEIPITTAELLGRRLPGGGGGYFRFFPYWFSKKLIQHVNERDQKPGIFYLHPWEIDPDQPRQNGISLKTRFRHYLNLHRMHDRLTRLLSDFSWDRMDRIFLDAVPDEPQTRPEAR